MITFDIDWVPAYVTDFIADILIQTGTKATWFATHPCPSLDRLRGRPDIFELGIHPNFRPNSSHGKTVSDVIEYARKLVPEARTMRTHGLIQSISLFDDIMRNTEVIADVTTYMPHLPELMPAEIWRAGRVMLRIPTYWQDELEMTRPGPVWNADRLVGRNSGKGVKVFNFHPIHVYVNRLDDAFFHDLIKEVGDLPNADKKIVDKYVRRDGEGPLSLLEGLCAHANRPVKLIEYAETFLGNRPRTLKAISCDPSLPGEA